MKLKLLEKFYHNN